MLRSVFLAVALATAAAAAEQGPAVRDPLTGSPLEELPVAPQPIHAPEPEYPLSALASGIEGYARFAFTVNADGEVERADIAAESPPGLGFGPSAAYTLKQWRFPEDAAGRYRIKINFKVHGGAAAPPDAPPPPPPAPKRVSGPDPIWPHLASVKGRGGDVVLDVQIAADGSVTDVTVVRENPTGYSFGAAAANAVRQWTFPPVEPNVYRYIFKFRLR